MSGPVFMNFPITATSHSLADYRARGGYAALEKALRELTPAQVGEQAKASGLQGRGGAGFQTGLKWEFVSKEAPVVYLCCNIDEGEPGTFKDRWILEHSPHQLLEGMLLASYSLRVRHAFAYIRGEFDLPLRRLQGALQEARAAGLVGENILGSGFACDIVIHRGAGAYVCGEESSLINSLEGKKGFPRNKPPFPAVQGPVPEAHGRQQRRDAGDRALDHGQRRRRSTPRWASRRRPARASSASRVTSRSRACSRSPPATRSRSSSARMRAASSVDGSSRP